MADAPWISSPLPGIEYKLLHRDEERRSTTRLLRLSEGATYPSHRHGGVEEVFVLDGALTLNGILLKPGDYCQPTPGRPSPRRTAKRAGWPIIVSSDLDAFDVAPAG